MRFLVDAALSPEVAELLRKAGHDAKHVRQIGLATAEDLRILQEADIQNRVLVSADTDFGTHLVSGQRRSPSVILFRGKRFRRPSDQARLITRNLDSLLPHLEDGCVAVFKDDHLRVRPL